MQIDRLNNIKITNEDIQWVEGIMGGKIHFDSARVDVIKNMDSVDIQAFPGSGKTTILVVKLAILARKWPYANSGISVLSHTNVAREEIEERLGSSEVGRKLLSYPHFIGTLHSFFDTYIALPWLRSRGFDINLIDTEQVQSLRWNMLPYKTRSYLERQYKNESICSYRGSIGTIDWDKNGETKLNILNIIEKTQKNGYFTFEEMLLYSKQALEECEEISTSIQQRFPILFIDEAQDTDAFQWDLLQAAFNKDGELSIRQGYGDSNQAIYSSLFADDELMHFPREDALILSESKRFDSTIAALANTVALSSAQMKGTNNVFCEKEINHTIFLFSKDKALQVICEFGQLLLDTFSDEELREYQKEGCHVVGMVHVKKEDTLEKQFPKGIYDYWELYEARKANKSATPKYLIEYFRNGIVDLQRTGEKAQQMEWIAKGLRRLINKAKNCNYIPASGNIFRAIVKALPDNCQKDFRKTVNELSNVNESISKTNWTSMVGIIKQILKLFDVTDFKDVKEFGKWIDEKKVEIQENESIDKVMPNHFIYTDKATKRAINLEFGSIHSVKGRTHLATLILETFLQTHNMKSILEFLCNTPPKAVKKNQKRLKCQYVAMTRARALLCLAIPVDFVDEKSQQKLREVGWKIRAI